MMVIQEGVGPPPDQCQAWGSGSQAGRGAALLQTSLPAEAAAADPRSAWLAVSPPCAVMDMPAGHGLPHPTFGPSGQHHLSFPVISLRAQGWHHSSTLGG